MAEIPFTNPKKKQSLAELVTSLPGLVVALVKDELTLLKAEVIDKVTKLGIGVGLLLVAVFLLFFVWCILLVAAVLGIATVLPAWLAALIVAGALLLIAVILALVGIRSIKKGVPPTPQQSIESIKKDLNAVKGLGEETPVDRAVEKVSDAVDGAKSAVKGAVS